MLLITKLIKTPLAEIRKQHVRRAASLTNGSLRNKIFQNPLVVALSGLYTHTEQGTHSVCMDLILFALFDPITIVEILIRGGETLLYEQGLHRYSLTNPPARFGTALLNL